MAIKITNRESIDERLRESESKYRELVENANSAIIRWKRDGTITFFNEYAQTFFGYSEDEVIGKHVGILVPEKESTGSDLTFLVRDIVSHPERYVQNINENICRDGKRVWMAWTNRPVFDEDGSVKEILAVGTDFTERKAAEESLRQLAQFSEENPNPALRCTLDGVIMYANAAARRWLETLGWEGDGPVPSPVGEAVVSTRGKECAMETEITNPSGHTMRISLVQPPGEDYINLYGIDITDRKETEAALKKSEERYRTLFESMTEGFALHEIVTDEQGRPVDYRFLEMNPAFERLTGLKLADLLGKRVLEVMPDTEPYWIENYGRVALTGEPMHFENHSSALCRWYEVFAYRPAPRQFAVVFTDISKRKKAEERERLEHRETAFANRVLRSFVEFEGDALFDQVLAVVQEEMASEYGVFGYIPQPGHLTCPSLSKMLDACEVEGKCVHYPPEKWKGLWARALTEKRSYCNNEAPHVPAGHSIIHNNLAVPILFHGEAIGLLNLANKGGGYNDEDQRTLEGIAARLAPVLYAWIQRNLREDERKQAEEQVKTALAEKEVLLKEIHHRVKNNMQVISSLVSLEADELEDCAVRDALQDVANRVRSMALVHERLYQSHDLARIDFAEYARSLLGYLWGAHGTGAEIRLTLDLEPVSLPVDKAVPCGLILNELASNTLKHAFRGRTGGEVAVSLRGAVDGQVRLCVRDNGRGLPAGFDWKQAQTLGLRLVQMLAGQIHAAVGVSRQGGTEFTLTFNRAEA